MEPQHCYGGIECGFPVEIRDLLQLRDWTITCEFEYEAEEDLASTNEANAIAYASICDDLTQLLESQEDADVTLVVKGEDIGAHRVILKARSTYFRAMFNSQMKESLSQTVEIHDVKPQVFRGLLRFLYTGQLPENFGDIALDLLTVADKYGVDSLKKLCASRLCDNLDDNNVIDAILVAERHNCDFLVDQARVYIKENHRALRRNEDNWKKLISDPVLLLALFEFACE